MTERFKLFVGKNYGVQKVDGEVIFDSIISMAEADVLVDLLNDLSEENDVLKQQLKTKVIVNKQYEELQRIKQENEQLKSTIKKVTELLSDEVDLFSEKATEHDIIAYEELKELDNKDAFYIATATKEAIKILKRCLND